MIYFVWPYLFLLLPLPWIVFKFFPESKWNERSALKVPEISDFECLKKGGLKSCSKVALLITSLIWIFFLTSLARPQQIKDPINIPKTGRDLMLAVDLSMSMQIKDFEIKGKYVDRLTALKLIASDFIKRRQGDRIGLILFGSEAYLQAPLTFDVSTVKTLLMETELGLAGTDTAIGDAVGLAVKHLMKTPQKSRVLILLTDGNNNSGSLTPEKASEIAANAGLKIHTVAIGSKEKARGMMPNADIDEKALQAMAEKTGGKYFRAYDTKQLVEIYSEIDQLESVETENQHYLPIEELYYWPLLFALLGSLVLIIYKMIV